MRLEYLKTCKCVKIITIRLEYLKLYNWVQIISIRIEYLKHIIVHEFILLDRNKLIENT